MQNSTIFNGKCTVVARAKQAFYVVMRFVFDGA